MDIKELALKVAKEMNWRMDEMTLETFATRLIAALEQQVAALTKARDELEISNAFAHGEWRAVKDQLAAMTKEHEFACEIGADYRDKWMAAQARESKLRDAMLSDSALAGRFHKLLALPTDDSALQALLKEERKRGAGVEEDVCGRLT